ncbi:hemicentin-2-like isoform X1 [Brachionus plicatilis]|uniref:Hemicentin-2-like isoform X1 n=1 Tax=Brachionus plicatilis TaxID=10195 RepID=A0A3M7PJ32_BRAPC|nr:hemicentin-2-like isoform X1 [Brachionus plicatilis]
MRAYFVVAIVWQVQLAMAAWPCDQNNCEMNVDAKSGSSIRFKSILSLGLLEANSSRVDKKIFWSFKRIYHTLDSRHQLSQQELMISLDSEVQDNLKSKYSIYLNDEHKFDLVVSNLSHADSGLYKCNLWNQKTIHYRLTVIEPIQKPALRTSHSQMAVEGDNLTLKCVSSNAFPFPKFTWSKDKQKIEQTPSTKLIDKETNLVESSLTIKNISSDLNGRTIGCSTEQTVNGSVLSTDDTLVLNVAYRPKLTLKIFNQNRSLTLSHGQNLRLFGADWHSVKFECSHDSNPQAAHTQWLLNSTQVLAHNTHHFTLSNVKPKVFTLTCEAQNSIGLSQMTVSIRPLQEPKIKLSQRVYQVDQLSPFQLNCVVESSGNTSRVVWKKMYSNESKEWLVVSENALLDFKQIKMKENAAFYECEVKEELKDSFGMSKQFRARHQMELLVRFVPIITVDYKKQAVNLSEKSVNLSCVTMSYPEATFAWFKNGRPLTAQKFTTFYVQKSKNLFESILNVRNVSEQDLDQKYECQASNELGSSRSHIQLVPLSKPDAPTQLRSETVGHSSASLSWSPAFNGGLDQFFVLQLNDSILPLTASPNTNITNLSTNSIYSIRVKATNELGSSNWSHYVLIRTRDLTQSDRHMLPLLDSLFLNVPKNRLEFSFSSEPSVSICLRVSGEALVPFRSSACLPTHNQSSLSLDQLELTEGSFDPRQVKRLQVDVCFAAKPDICSQRQMTAIIDTYDKISHLVKQSDNFFSHLLAGQNSLPVVLTVAISVCVLALVFVLFVTIIICMRKSRLKLCKSLLTSGTIGKRPFENFLCDQSKLAQAKSFNIDITSISAPVASTVSISGSQLTSSTSSDHSNQAQSRRTFAATLTHTAHNILLNSIGRANTDQILVTDEDGRLSREQEFKLDSATPSTAVSNCSSQNLHAPYTFTDYTLFDQKCESSSGSNSDPIAINNSLTSHSASDSSPIYGYNIAGATTAHTQSTQHGHLESVFQMQQMNFDTQSSGQVDSSTLVRQQMSSVLSKQMKCGRNGDTTESGYSTPSRPKKVIYEVIV